MRNVLLLILMLMALQIKGQSFDGSIEADAAVGISPRWQLKGAVNLAAEQADVNCLWGGAQLGAAFNFYSKYSLAFAARCSYADYNHLDNSDLMTILCEGIDIKNSDVISQKIYFEQWRVHYRPSKVNTSATGLSYAIALDKPLRTENPWHITGRASFSTNISSDEVDNKFLRRVRIGAGVKRQISTNVSIEIFYNYMFAGENQIYMGDMDNLHTLKFLLHINKL